MVPRTAAEAKADTRFFSMIVVIAETDCDLNEPDNENEWYLDFVLSPYTKIRACVVLDYQGEEEGYVKLTAENVSNESATARRWEFYMYDGPSKLFGDQQERPIQIGPVITMMYEKGWHKFRREKHAGTANWTCWVLKELKEERYLLSEQYDEIHPQFEKRFLKENREENSKKRFTTRGYFYPPDESDYPNSESF